jgi:hypothetical protein
MNGRNQLSLEFYGTDRARIAWQIPLSIAQQKRLRGIADSLGGEGRFRKHLLECAEDGDGGIPTRLGELICRIANYSDAEAAHEIICWSTFEYWDSLTDYGPRTPRHAQRKLLKALKKDRAKELAVEFCAAASRLDGSAARKLAVRMFRAEGWRRYSNQNREAHTTGRGETT